MTAMERYRTRLLKEIIGAYKDSGNPSFNDAFRAKRRGMGEGLELALALTNSKYCSCCGWKKPKKPRRVPKQ